MVSKHNRNSPESDRNSAETSSAGGKATHTSTYASDGTNQASLGAKPGSSTKGGAYAKQLHCPGLSFYICKTGVGVNQMMVKESSSSKTLFCRLKSQVDHECGRLFLKMVITIPLIPVLLCYFSHKEAESLSPPFELALLLTVGHRRDQM